MKKFLFRVVLSLGIPLLLLVLIYVVTDPFKMLRPFSLNYFDGANRDYLSTELFLRNNPKYHYNSFIFGSSKCNGINSYHWNHYLSDSSRQFVFQAWRETITGIELKIDFLDQNGNDIDNALLLFDIPHHAFDKVQLSNEAMFIKHYRLTGQPKFVYHTRLFMGFIQKPSKWVESVKRFIVPESVKFPADTISNDWNLSGRVPNREVDFHASLPKDSLFSMSSLSRKNFLKANERKTDADLVEYKPVITQKMIVKLEHIKAVFDSHHTNYYILISPTYCYTNPCINRKDLKVLQSIFGEDRVINYSGKNEFTSDYNNFSDPEHFGLSVGWQIIEDIYNK